MRAAWSSIASNSRWAAAVRLAILLVVAALVATACSAGPPIADEYRLVEIDSIDTERWRSGGDCDLDYRSQLHRFDTATGQLEWSIEFPYSQSPLYLSDGGVVTAIGATKDWPGGLVSVAADGSPRWRAEVPSGPGRMFESSEDLFLTAFRDDETRLLRVGRDGALRWDTVVDAWVFSGPYLVGDSVVLTTEGDLLVVIDAATGTVVEESGIGYEVSGIGLVADDLVYTAAYDGRIVTIDATGTISDYPVPPHPHWVLAVVDGLVVYTRNDGMAALDLSDGSIAWELESTAPFAIDAAGSLLVGLSPQGLRSIVPEDATLEWQFFGRSGSVMIAEWVDPLAVAAIRLGNPERSPDGYLLAAVDRDDPEKLAWDLGLPGRPTIVEITDATLVVGGRRFGPGPDVDAPDAGWVLGIDPASGELLWEMTTREPPASLVFEKPAAFLLTADEPIFCD